MEKGRKGTAGGRAGRKILAPSPTIPLRPALPADAHEPSAQGEPRWTALLSLALPLQFCAVNSAHGVLGLAMVVVARALDQHVVCAHFAVDLLARGVIDCYGTALLAEDFPLYVDDLDESVPLETCSEQAAGGLVWGGAALGARHGVEQPVDLDLWGRLLPRSAAAWASPAGPVLAIAEMLAPARGRGEDAWAADEPQVTGLIVACGSDRDQ